MRPADTSPEAHRQQIDAWRHLTGEERLAIAFELSDWAHDLAEAGRSHRAEQAAAPPR